MCGQFNIIMHAHVYNINNIIHMTSLIFELVVYNNL